MLISQFLKEIIHKIINEVIITINKVLNILNFIL